MKTSLLGIKAIARREGTILHVYKDSKGLPTAGVGHLITPAEKADHPVGKKITQAQSDAWLAADLKKCEDAVNSLNVALKQNEFDALVSLAFNIGVGAASGPKKGGFLGSTVARRLKAGDKPGAAKAILLWNKPPEIQGRRRTEYNQFLTPYKTESAAAPASIPQMAAKDTPPVITASEPDATQQPPPSTTVEHKETEAAQTPEGSKAVQTTVTTETPKGDPPDAPATKVSTNGPLAKWIAGGGGLTAIGTMLWGFIQANLSAVAIAVICLTLLIIVLIFRGAITDAIRMQVAADPDKRNVS